ncbi:MAG: hypothetical protein LQ342_008279 [Letrouitia transgressa]|nr:MAG: hypothetical protein LQ342_008279 [Letrouitia transgressa]
MAAPSPLRIGYVPEHFSTPFHFARLYFSLSATLIPFPSGTGHLVTSLRSNEIDIAIGLTEGFIAALAKPPSTADNGQAFKLVGTYVETPLCWAISTGSRQDDLGSADHLEGKKIGVSRIGSGSYLMGFVFADQKGWLRDNGEQPFEVLSLQTFEKLRKAVNNHTADFFMWEHFTSKRYYDSGEIKRIGEIYTPWSSWKIAARDDIIQNAADNRLSDFLEKLNLGVKYFEDHAEEAVSYISTALDYSEDDAKEWMKGVKFKKDVKGVKKSTVERTFEILRKAGVVGQEEGKVEEVVGFMSEE